MTNNVRTAVILCGGKGTRLGLISKKIAKTLIKIHNKEILWYIINILKINKFNHFILPIGYKGKQIKDFIKKEFRNENNIEIIDTGVNSSIASRINKIKNFIKSENFLLLNGDAIFDFDINNIYLNHVKKKIKMTYISFDFQADFGTITMKDSNVIGFQRNLHFNYVGSKNKKGLRSYVYSGISLMNKKLLSKKYDNFKNFEKQLYPLIIKKNKCTVKTPSGFFTSIDNIKDILRLNFRDIEDSRYKGLKNVKRKIKKFKFKNDYQKVLEK